MSVIQPSGIEKVGELGRRRYWLKAQYADDPPTEREYDPWPYQQLARVWRAAGNLTAADEITFDKLKLEKVRLKRDSPSRPGSAQVSRVALAALVTAVLADTYLLARPAGSGWSNLVAVPAIALAVAVAILLMWPFGHRIKQLATYAFVEFPFGFGLRLRRSVVTFMFVYLVGLAAVSFIELKVDAQAAPTVVSTGERVVVPVAGPQVTRDEIDCGDLINSFIYPLDVMIPLIDLRQESRCQFSITSGVLSAAKGLYAIVGWIVTSGLILTLSGVVRRRIEG